MKKKDFLALIAEKLKDFSDDDEVVVEVDGGDYWGNYRDDFVVEVKDVNPEYGVHVGHPKHTERRDVKKIAIIKDC